MRVCVFVCACKWVKVHGLQKRPGSYRDAYSVARTGTLDREGRRRRSLSVSALVARVVYTCVRAGVCVYVYVYVCVCVCVRACVRVCERTWAAEATG